MKVTKSQLKEIIKEELAEAQRYRYKPAHLKGIGPGLDLQYRLEWKSWKNQIAIALNREHPANWTPEKVETKFNEQGVPVSFSEEGDEIPGMPNATLTQAFDNGWTVQEVVNDILDLPQGPILEPGEAGEDYINETME